MPSEKQREIKINLDGKVVVLRGDGTAVLSEFNALLVTDLHLGKDTSFRSEGIPVPREINEAMLKQLSRAIEETEVDSLYFLGDLIHDANSIDGNLQLLFEVWRTLHPRVSMTLIRGNHDRHVLDFPESWQMETALSVQLGHFELRHKVSDETLELNDKIQLGGHWHPVTFVGKGADRMRLPCFVVGEHHVTLPAFGPFKGGMAQRPTKDTELIPICDGTVLRI